MFRIAQNYTQEIEEPENEKYDENIILKKKYWNIKPEFEENKNLKPLPLQKDAENDNTLDKNVDFKVKNAKNPTKSKEKATKTKRSGFHRQNPSKLIN